ncbi:MAG TPA: hypothetical protein VGI03_08260 [Verrucomicrobiae bacterium]
MTGEPIRDSVDRTTESIFQKYQRLAEEQIGHDAYGNPQSALKHYLNRYDEKSIDHQNAFHIINHIHDSNAGLTDVAICFLALREATGINFRMFDVDEVEEWATDAAYEDKLYPKVRSSSGAQAAPNGLTGIVGSLSDFLRFRPLDKTN